MKTISTNKKASFRYEILDRFEAGLLLKGSEVKSLREGHGSISESFGRARGNELWLCGMDIPRYEPANTLNHDPRRERKLLLRKREIKILTDATAQKGFTLVPLSLYFKRGWVKVEIAIARGKTSYDKRETIKKRDAHREIDRGRRIQSKHAKTR